MPSEQLTIDDLVLLGRGAPDRIRDGRITICAAGWSKTHGFVRIYPTRTSSPLRQWNQVAVPVERNPLDSRPESWKIQGSKSEWNTLDRKIEVVGELKQPDRRRVIRELVSPCVNSINESRVSLGIVRPVEMSGFLDERTDVDDGIQLTLTGPPQQKTKQGYRFQPRLRYRCSGCTAAESHDQQIIEWGCYEWFRKNPGLEAQVFENLRLEDPAYEKHLFVGNQANHRVSYLVITVLRWKRDTP
ncbi:MAG: hypothetical protein ABR888_00035 [Thermoplasmata archaeon]|jgi:hypothetical protein